MTNEQINQLKTAMEYDVVYYVDGSEIHKCVRFISSATEPASALEDGRCVPLLSCSGAEFVRVLRIFGDINK